MNDSDTLKNRRLLIIDDNPSIPEDNRKILGGGGGQDAAFGDAKAMLPARTCR
jgi:hypothetical protein